MGMIGSDIMVKGFIRVLALRPVSWWIYLSTTVFGMRKESDLKSYPTSQCALIGTDLRHGKEGMEGEEEESARMDRSHKRRRDQRLFGEEYQWEKQEVGVIPDFREDWINSVKEL